LSSFAYQRDTILKTTFAVYNMMSYAKQGYS